MGVYISMSLSMIHHKGDSFPFANIFKGQNRDTVLLHEQDVSPATPKSKEERDKKKGEKLSCLVVVYNTN